MFGSPGQDAPGIVNFLPGSETGLTFFTRRFQETGVRLADNNIVELKETRPEEAITWCHEAYRDMSLAKDDILRISAEHELARTHLKAGQVAKSFELLN